ncbi:MAG: T9SS type A sorting domain-containing protein [Bacteroidota bacterium]
MNAQFTLTLGQVYDYAAGDIFQYRVDLSGDSPEYITDTVFSKTISLNLDTIKYNVHRYSYKLANCFSCSPIITTSTYSETYYNLNTPFNYANLSTCCSTSLCTKDTLLANVYCNRKTFRSLYVGSVNPGSVSPCIKNSADFSEGLGQTYYYDEGWSTTYNITTQMIYFNKSSTTCGAYVGIAEILPHQSFSLFPNPTALILTVSENTTAYNHDNYSMEIVNSMGQSLISLPYQTQIDISKFSSGMYFLNIRSNKGSVESFKFIKE